LIHVLENYAPNKYTAAGWEPITFEKGWKLVVQCKRNGSKIQTNCDVVATDQPADDKIPATDRTTPIDGEDSNQQEPLAQDVAQEDAEEDEDDKSDDD
jgi:hypothetical protein